MGGSGSGLYGSREKTRKRRVEETIGLSISTIKEHLNYRSFVISWLEGSQEIRVQTQGDHIILKYFYGEETKKVNTRVNILKSKVGFGDRLWFECPCCSRTVGKVYCVSGAFACRVCHDLTYATCQESGDPLDYLGLKIWRLQLRLGLEGDDIDETPLFKPKYMHQNTFDILRIKLEIIQMHRVNAWLMRNGGRNHFA